MSRTRIKNAMIFQWYSNWFDRLCNVFIYWFNNFGGNNKYRKFFFFPIMIGFFNMTRFTIVWTSKLLFSNNISDYRLCNRFGLWVSYQGIVICYNFPLSSQIIADSLCLIRVSLSMPTIASLRYCCKPILKIVVWNTLIALICKHLTRFNKCS